MLGPLDEQPIGRATRRAQWLAVDALDDQPASTSEAAEVCCRRDVDDAHQDGRRFAVVEGPTVLALQLEHVGESAGRKVALATKAIDLSIAYPQKETGGLSQPPVVTSARVVVPRVACFVPQPLASSKGTAVHARPTPERRGSLRS